jgi:hypothetical protein
MAVILSRNAKLFVTTEKLTSGSDTLALMAERMTNQNTWQIPVLDGFSFTQSVATQEVQISEAGTAPARGQRVFNTALEPVNWSFSNYMRPRHNATANLGDAVERIMWEAHAAPPTANNVSTVANGLATTRVTGNGTISTMTVDYNDSNTNQLLSLSLFFKLDAEWFWIKDAVVDTAEIDFSIDSIATITWSGFANEVVRLDATSDAASITSLNEVAANGDGYADLAAPADGYLAAPSDTACIRNKLTTLVVQDKNDSDKAYTLPITGGSITISNNITYLTPESLGVLNKPCGHFTGARTVNGNLTAYLNTSDDHSAELMGKLQSSLQTNIEPGRFNTVITLGGAAGAAPTIDISIPHNHLVVPVINVEDIISLDIGFSGLPYNTGTSTHDLTQTNEVSLTYRAAV